MAFWSAKNIEIPGWAPKIINKVYVRERESTGDQEFLTICRYKEPTEAEIVARIKKGIDTIDNYVLPLIIGKTEAQVKVSSLDYLIFNLHQGVRNDITRNHEGALRMLSNFIQPFLTLDGGEQYVQLMTGNLPPTTEEKSKGQPERNFTWYFNAMTAERLVTLHLPKGNLPSFADVKTMLRHKTYISGLLSAIPGSYTDDFSSFVEKMYRALKGRMGLLEERTEFTREAKAYYAMQQIILERPYGGGHSNSESGFS